MSRRPTKRLTLQFVLRTLKRLQMMTRLDDKGFAQVLLEQKRPPDVGFLGEYLEGVANEMRKLGFDPCKHPNGNCACCGEEILRDHNAARYCSTACRTRAWRKRLETLQSGPEAHGPSQRDASNHPERKSNARGRKMSNRAIARVLNCSPATVPRDVAREV